MGTRLRMRTPAHSGVNWALAQPSKTLRSLCHLKDIRTRKGAVLTVRPTVRAYMMLSAFGKAETVKLSW